MTTPIPDLPEVPLPSQNRPDFEETVETFLLSLQPWADAANVLGGEMEVLAGNTSDDAEAAAASALAAALSAVSIVDYNGESNTELTIGAGSHELTVDVGKRWIAGTWVSVVDMADPATNYMDGRVVSYDDETGAMEIYVETYNFGGSGTYTAWNISLSARQKDVAAQVAAAEAAQAAAEAAAEQLRTETDEPTHVFEGADGGAGVAFYPDGTIRSKQIDAIQAAVDPIEGRVEVRTDDAVFAIGDPTDGSGFALYPDGTIGNKHIETIDGRLDALEDGSATATNDLAPLGTLPHIMIYGQSLSIGTEGQPVVSSSGLSYAKKFVGGVRTRDGSADYTTHYASLANLSETSVSTNGETIASGMAVMLNMLLTDENGYDLAASGRVPLFSAPGEGGRSAAELSSGTTYFTRLKADITAGEARAADAARSYQTLAMPYLQAEQDYTVGTDATIWGNQVKQIRSDAQAWAEATQGFSRALPMILYQVAQHIAKSTDPTLAIEATRLAEVEPLIGFATSMYHFDYLDTAHLAAETYYWLGAYFGLALKRWCWDGLKPLPMSPSEVIWTGKSALLRFDRAIDGLSLDTTQVTDPGDYGFALREDDGTTEITVSAVNLVEENMVEVRSASSLPSGTRLRYAWYSDDPVAGASTSGRLYGARGCLRDNRGTTIFATAPDTTVLPLHQWCPIFEEIKA